MAISLYYFHDPMCSWCWGYRPIWNALKASLAGRMPVISVLGGLAPDTDTPMPAAMRQAIQGHWHRIQAMLGTEFNFDFWHQCEPRRATYPACRAVVAAARQGHGDAMVAAIQEAYYLRAMNPSETATLSQLAAELAIDVERFAVDLNAPATHRELKRQVDITQKFGVPGFPSLVLTGGSRRHHIEVDYMSYGATLAAIAALVRQDPSDAMSP